MKKLVLALMVCGLVGCGEDALTPIDRCVQAFVKKEGQDAVNRECNSLSLESMNVAKSRVLEIDPTNTIKIMNDGKEIGDEKARKDVSDNFGPTINVSYVEAIKDFNEVGMVMTDSPLNTGEPRMMGTSNQDKALVTIEIMGNKDNINRATMLIGVPNNNDMIILGNVYCIGLFMRNLVPEFKGSTKWATNAIAKIGNGEGDQHKIIGNKKITISKMVIKGIFFIAVEHKDRKESLDSE